MNNSEQQCSIVVNGLVFQGCVEEANYVFLDQDLQESIVIPHSTLFFSPLLSKDDNSLKFPLQSVALSYLLKTLFLIGNQRFSVKNDTHLLFAVSPEIPDMSFISNK